MCPQRARMRFPLPAIVRRHQDRAVIANGYQAAVAARANRLEIALDVALHARPPRAIGRARDEATVADDDPRAVLAERERGERSRRAGRDARNVALTPAIHHTVEAEHDDLVAQRIHRAEPRARP